jgi:hypothetical protein
MPNALLLALALLSLPAGAADIYRWVDENGRVHISDVVPEKYRSSAKRLDTGPEPSPQERAAAEARAAAERERAKASEAAAAAAAPSAPAPSAAPPKPAEDDCALAHRKYKDSIACFAPFINSNGTTRAEAFQYCVSVPDPSPRCGPAPQESSERTY